MAKLVPNTHPALHAIAEEVPLEEIGSAKMKKILKDMKKALSSYDVEGYIGVAIAAPQIGIPLRIFLVHDTGADRRNGDEELIPDIVAFNPTIIKKSRESKMLEEGCLSVPEKYGTVKRSTRATIRAYDEKGKPFEFGAAGLLAQIFQHECDHLDGILFIDRATKTFDVNRPKKS